MYRFFLFLSILLFSFLSFFSYSYAAIDLTPWSTTIKLDNYRYW